MKKAQHRTLQKLHCFDQCKVTVGYVCRTRKVGVAFSEENSEIYVVGFKRRSLELVVWTLRLDFSGVSSGTDFVTNI